MKKWILKITLLLMGFYTGIWLFNHINAWIGIVCVLLMIYISIKIIIKQIKN
jgi:uncharacterized membrane protein